MSIQTSPAKTDTAKAEQFLVIDKVSKVYPTAKSAYTVLEDVSLTVEEGEFICIIGHSGCGKSTLLNMVAGFSQPTEGEVRLQNRCITKPGPDRMMVFQNYCLLPWKTALENVLLAVKSAYPEKTHKERLAIAEEHLAMVGLTEAAHKRPGQMSGGMKQRVAIARALAIRPQVLILDEPFGALDAITKEELQEELLQIWRDHRCTVLMITHDIDEALFLADKLVMMTNGPAAKIGEVLEIPFPRPRVRARVMEDPRYYELRNYALDFLFRRFAHDEDGGTEETVSPSPRLPISPSPRLLVSALAATASALLLAGGLYTISQMKPQKELQSTSVQTTTIAPPPQNQAMSGTTIPEVTDVPPSASTPTPTPSLGEEEGKAETSPTITDTAKIAELNQKLYDQIDQNWWKTPTFTENLVFHVEVSGDGAIVQYEFGNQAASNYLEETPFAPDAPLGATPDPSQGSEPVARFEVILTPTGELQVTIQE
ncbi:MAG: hypothetical protein Fur0025_07650 [Oscillatoriaceae cyanobacterium]